MSKLTFAFVLAMSAIAAGAQSWTGDYILGGSSYSQSDGVFRVTRQNVFTTVATGIESGTSAYVWEVIMAEDNRDYYVLTQGTGSDSIVRMDPSGIIVSTVYTGTGMTTPVNMHMDQDGNLIVLDTSSAMSTLWSINPQIGALTPFATMQRGDSLYGSAARDIETGDDLVFVNDVLIRVDRATRAATTVVSIGTRVARMGLAQDTLSGLAYGGTCCANTLYEMDPVGGSSTLLVGAQNLWGNYGLKFDRRVDASMNRMINVNNVFSTTTRNHGISIIDTTGVVTSVHRWPGGTGTVAPYSLEIEGSREVQPQLVTPPNNRQINLSFPTAPGLGYACAVNISGIRPGVRLGDGRVINFVLDDVAIGVLQGALDVFIPNRVGVLDAQGRAVTGLNLNLLGNALSGVSVTFQVIVLDPQAPSGVAVVAEPYTLKLD